MRRYLLFACVAIVLQPNVVFSQRGVSPVEASTDRATIEVSGFVRARHVSIYEAEDGPDFIGQNDGFFLENARLVTDVKKRAMFARISIDGAVDRRDAAPVDGAPGR